MSNTTLIQTDLQDEPSGLIYTAVVCSSLSLVGSGSILISFLMTKTYRSHFYYFWVFNLAIADFLISAGGLFNWNNPKKSECNFFAVILGMGLESSFFFILYIALIIYYSTTKSISTRILFKKSTQIILLTYIITMIFALGPLFTDSYGVGSTFCWLKLSDNGFSLFWSIIEYYIPIVVILVVTTYIYLKIYFLARGDYGFGVQSNRYVYFFLLIPIIYLLTNIFAITDRILFELSEPVIWVQIIHILFRQLQGFYHAIIYGYATIKYSVRNDTVVMRGRANPGSDSGSQNLLQKDSTGTLVYGSTTSQF